MNRLVKFRIWDKKRQKFLTSDNIIIRLNGEIAGVYGGRGTVKDWVLSQSTGLKDKNGKDIYEGDILKWLSNGLIISIHYRDDWAAFGQKMYNGMPNSWGILSDHFSPCIEIIGNIYENSNLLPATDGEHDGSKGSKNGNPKQIPAVIGTLPDIKSLNELIYNLDELARGDDTSRTGGLPVRNNLMMGAMRKCITDWLSDNFQ